MPTTGVLVTAVQFLLAPAARRLTLLPGSRDQLMRPVGPAAQVVGKHIGSQNKVPPEIQLIRILKHG